MQGNKRSSTSLGMTGRPLGMTVGLLQRQFAGLGEEGDSFGRKGVDVGDDVVDSGLTVGAEAVGDLLDGAGEHLLRIDFFRGRTEEIIEANHDSGGERDFRHIPIDGGAGVLQCFSVWLDRGNIAPPGRVVRIGLLGNKAHHARLLPGDQKRDAARWLR